MLRSLAILLSSVAVLFGTVQAQFPMTHSFCYTIYNTNGATSPYLQWGVQTVGALTITNVPVVASYGLSGFLVTNATGTRTNWAQGISSTQTIIGIAPQGTYFGNDNLLDAAAGAPTVPGVINTAYGGLTFVSSSPVIVANGVAANDAGLNNGASGRYYFNVNSNITPRTAGGLINEADLPQNDGLANSVTSVWVLQPYNASFVCPTTLPSMTVPAASLTAFQQTQVFSFCYSFTGGPGDGTNPIDATIWYTNVQGEFITTSYSGTAGTRTGAFLIVGIQNAKRTYIYPNGTSVVENLIAIGGVNAAQAQEGSTLFYGVGNLFYSDNVFYNSYPNLDLNGVSLIGDATFTNPSIVSTANKVTRVFIDPKTQNVEERQFDVQNAYYYTSTLGSFVATPSATRPGASLSAWAAQCAPGGATSWYAFCYTIDAGPSYYEYSFGIMSGVAGQTRAGRSAMTAQTMNGVRTVTLNGQLNTTSILALEYIKEGISYYGISTDNIIFTDGASPLFSTYGLLILGNNYQLFPQGAATSIYGNPFTDYVLKATALTGSNVTVSSPANPTLFVNAPSITFTMNAISGPSDLTQATCSNTVNSALVTQAIKSYSFCYYITGPGNNGYSIGVSGVMNVYQTPVYVGGRMGYPIHSLSGTRTYRDGLGHSSVTPIVSLSMDGFAFTEWYYNQVLFTSFPYFDSNGVLYKVNQPTWTPTGLVYGDQVLNFFYDSNLVFNEEAYYKTSTGGIGAVDAVVGSFVAIPDGGATASTILNSQCSYTAGTPQIFSWCFYVENDGQGSNKTPWYILAYGTLNATGAVIREGRSDAYTIQALSGVRVVQVNGATPSTTVQQITNIRKVKEDLGSAGLVNDNVFFLNYSSLGQLTDQGFDYVVAGGNVKYPFSTAKTNIGNFYFDQTGLGEYVDWNSDDSTYVETSLSAFNVAPGANGVQCSSPDRTVQPPANKYFQFCYSITGATGYVVSASGYFTTVGVPVISRTGRTGYVVTGVNGTRNYTDATGVVFTQNFVSIDISTESLYVNGYLDNILYASYPFFDGYGLNVVTDGQAMGPGGVANGNILNLYIDGSGDFQELSFTSAYPYGLTLVLGNIVVAPTSAALASTPQLLLANQCSFQAGTPTQFQFCYALQPNTETTDKYSTYGYGTFTALGPVDRDGRQAYTILAGKTPVQGARITTDGTGKQVYQYITSVAQIKTDLAFGLYSDNLLFTSTPQLDDFGVVLGLSANVTVPSQTRTVVSSSSQIKLSYNTFGDGTGNIAFIETSGDGLLTSQAYNSNFLVIPYSASTYPPTSCGLNVVIPTGNWTASAGGQPGSGGSSNSGGSSSSSNSNLSNSAVAGIVIGVAAFCSLCAVLLTALCCGLCGAAAGKSRGGEHSTTGKYSAEVPSQVGVSQVEMGESA